MPANAETVAGKAAGGPPPVALPSSFGGTMTTASLQELLEKNSDRTINSVNLTLGKRITDGLEGLGADLTREISAVRTETNAALTKICQDHKIFSEETEEKFIDMEKFNLATQEELGKMKEKTSSIDAGPRPASQGGSSFRRSSSAPPAGLSEADSKAKDPSSLRLKGFTHFYIKPELIKAARAIIAALEIDNGLVVEIFASGRAKSCVIKFIDEKTADVAFKKAREMGPFMYTEDQRKPKSPLKLTHGESREIARARTVLRVLYTKTQEAFNDIRPRPTYALSTFRPGLALDLFDGTRRVPLFNLCLVGESTYRFDDTDIDFEAIKEMAPWITKDILVAIKVSASCDDLFEDL